MNGALQYPLLVTHELLMWRNALLCRMVLHELQKSLFCELMHRLLGPMYVRQWQNVVQW